MSFKTTMPAMQAHAGVWVGEYTHMGADGAVLDRHTSRVECVFPEQGEYAYVQHNHLTWDDGREQRATLCGVFRDGQLRFDTENFSGHCWETRDGIIMLNLERFDEPGARFYESIVLGDTGAHRARSWLWFKEGRLFKTTLCNESRES